MMRIGNRIVADNQRRMFDKLLQQNIGFFSDRHSSEFIARLTTGATAANQVLTLLITSIGRDLLSLIGLFAVMVIQDPVMSLIGVVVAPPAMIVLRKLMRRVRAIAHHAVHRRHAHDRDPAGDAAGHARRQGIHARRRDARALRRQRRRRCSTKPNKWARVANRASPLMEALGGFAIALAHDLQRLPGHRQRCDARAVLLVPRRVPARLRAGQAAGAAQPRAQQPSGRRAHAVRDHGLPADRAGRRRQAGAEAHHRAGRIRRRAILLSAGRDRCCAACRSSPSPAR